MGIPIPDVDIYSHRLHSLVDDLEVRVTITKIENYHFTTHFFGDIEIPEIENILNSIDILNFEEFTFELGRPDYLPQPNKKKARVVYIAPISGLSELNRLHKTTRENVMKMGFQVSSRKFLPHLTVGRIRQGREVIKLVDRWLEQEFETKIVTVNKIHLYESEITRSGRMYNPLHTVYAK